MALTKIPSSLLDTASGLDLQGNITLGDNEEVQFGDSSELKIFNDGTNSVLRSTDNLLIQRGTSPRSAITITDSTGEVALAYGGSTVFQTSSAGATVTGTLTVTGDLDITGNVNSYNVTDLDVTDQTITLGAGQTEANSGGSGIIVDGSNASILWDETNTEWDFNNNINVTGTVTADGGLIEGSTGLTIRNDAAGANEPKLVFDNDLFAGANYGKIQTGNGGLQLILESPSTSTFQNRHKIVLNGGGSDDITFSLSSDNGSSYKNSLKIENNDISFYEDTGTTAKLFWDASAESLGIGTNNPTDKIHLNGAANASTGITIGNNNSTRLRLYHDDNAGSSYLTTDGMQTEQRLYIMSGNELRLGSDGTERMRINTNGEISIGFGNSSGPGGGLFQVNSSGVFTNGGAGYIQGSILLRSSDNDETPSYRGQGVFTWNVGSQSSWFIGTPYTNGDLFTINRKSSESSFTQESSYIGHANTNNFFTIKNNGCVGLGSVNPTESLYVGNINAGGADVSLGLQNTISNRISSIKFYDESGSNKINLSYDNGSNRGTLSMGDADGEIIYVYDNASTIKSGLGIDLSGSGRELSLFHSSSGTDGDISFGKRLESNGSYTEAVRITGQNYIEQTPISIGALNNSAVGTYGGGPASRMATQVYNFTTLGDNTWRVLFSDFTYSTGFMYATVGDAASKDMASYAYAVTFPGYGVSSFSNISYTDGGWNTGAFEFRITSNGSNNHNLEVRFSSYYSSSNSATGWIKFERLT